MKLGAIAFVAALAPATAFAVPNQPDQPVPQQPQPSQTGPSQTVPMDTGRTEVDTFESEASQGGLGLTLMNLTPDLRGHYGAPRDSGLLVAKVAKGSPAERAGIRIGDVLTRVGGTKITSPDDIDSATSKADANQKIAIEVIRDHKTVDLQALPTSSATGQKPGQ
jgi:S1-C subfamily serine protease